MKNKIILPLIAIIFLSSCANKFSLTKRKYTKGYYFASSTHNSSAKKENEHKETVAKKLPAKNAALPVSSLANLELKNTTPAEFNKIEYVSPSSKKQHHKTVILTASANDKKDVSVKSDIKPVAQKQIYDKTKKGDSDVNLILLIILCLFPILALIAIYLKDGKTITLNFWIDLILHFLFLYWLFALLVVLDVIDLK
ncbi:MAG: hypothetical protein H0U95_15740 [Bacteroidetes bacterium]|nr:hypothetical protein [Bacteroidota bacterium]